MLVNYRIIINKSKNIEADEEDENEGNKNKDDSESGGENNDDDNSSSEDNESDSSSDSDDDDEDTIHVKECLFFGSSLQTSKEAQGTMIHVVTFDGRMQIMMNFTSPGIQDRPFMENIAKEVEATLQLIAHQPRI